MLRTVLRELELAPTTAPDEPWHFRGIAFAPGRGGLATVRRRAAGAGDGGPGLADSGELAVAA